MLDYRFLDSCVDTDLIRSILQKLRSGEEGLYPDLIKVCDIRKVSTTARLRVGVVCQLSTATSYAVIDGNHYKLTAVLQVTKIC